MPYWGGENDPLAIPRVPLGLLNFNVLVVSTCARLVHSFRPPRVNYLLMRAHPVLAHLGLLTIRVLAYSVGVIGASWMPRPCAVTLSSILTGRHTLDRVLGACCRAVLGYLTRSDRG